MNWKKFKEEVEKRLIEENCDNPDLAEIEGIDIKSVMLASSIIPSTTKLEILSYYKEKNSFYIVS